MDEDLIGFPEHDTVISFPTVYWKVWDVDATFLPGSLLPEGSLGRLWAALTIVYYGDKVVLADIEGRGLCIPSGKIEAGETLDQAAEREVYEETGARVDPDRRRLVGCYRMVVRATRAVRYCPVFVAEVVGFEPIPDGSESRGIFLAAIEDLSDLYFTWDDLMAAVFEHAARQREALLPSGVRLSEVWDED